MDSFSIWHWLILMLVTLSFAFLVLFPYSRIFRQAGYSGWLALLMLIPIVNLITLWVFAFSKWPTTRTGPLA